MSNAFVVFLFRFCCFYLDIYKYTYTHHLGTVRIVQHIMHICSLYANRFFFSLLIRSSNTSQNVCLYIATMLCMTFNLYSTSNSWAFEKRIKTKRRTKTHHNDDNNSCTSCVILCCFSVKRCRYLCPPHPIPYGWQLSLCSLCQQSMRWWQKEAFNRLLLYLNMYFITNDLFASLIFSRYMHLFTCFKRVYTVHTQC